MGTAKREHTPAFKAQVALVAIRGDRTRSEVAAQYHLHLNRVAHWRKLLLANRADITYWPMPSGFLYLVAAIDGFSRYVVAGRLSNTLEGWFGEEMLGEVLGVAVVVCGELVGRRIAPRRPLDPPYKTDGVGAMPHLSPAVQGRGVGSSGTS